MYLKDIRADPRKKLLIQELQQYISLKSAWGLGHIRVKYNKRECEYCEERHCVITGYYRDYYELTKQSMYLGRSYAHAHSRMNQVKAFL